MKIGFYLNIILNITFVENKGFVAVIHAFAVKGNDNYVGQKVNFDFGSF